MSTSGPNLGQIEYAAQGVVWYAELKRMLRALDGLIQPSVKDKDLTAPPGGEANGDRYIVGAGATGAWSGQSGKVARYQTDDGTLSAGYEFFTPTEGWRVYVQDENLAYRFDGSAWGKEAADLSATDIASGTLPNARLDAELQALAGLSSAADSLPYFTGSGTAALTTLTSFIRTLLDDADAAAARATLGVDASGSAVVSDGDKGDITVSASGTTYTIDTDVVTYAKMQNVSATDKLLGRSTAGAGDVEEVTCTAFGRSLIDDAAASNARTTLVLVPGTDVVTYNNNNRDVAIPFIVDGGGSTITTGVKGFVEIPFAGTIVSARMFADQTGSIVVDIWKDTYANYPPTVADTITASAKPTISSTTKSQDTTLTGWTTSVTAGDVLGFNVDSITTCQRVTVSLVIRRT